MEREFVFLEVIDGDVEASAQPGPARIQKEVVELYEHAVASLNDIDEREIEQALAR